LRLFNGLQTWFCPRLFFLEKVGANPVAKAQQSPGFCHANQDIDNQNTTII